MASNKVAKNITFAENGLGGTDLVIDGEPFPWAVSPGATVHFEAHGQLSSVRIEILTDSVTIPATGWADADS